MKQILLIVVFIVFNGQPVASQESISEKNLTTALSELNQTQNLIADSNPAPAIVIGSTSQSQVLPKGVGRRFACLMMFADQCTFQPLASSAREKQFEADRANASEESFHLSSAIKQSLIFLGVQHGYALTQPKTRRDLKGPFFKDYTRSVSSLHGWADGGKFFTNYIAHPMQGSLLGFIQVQNDPKGKKLRYNESKAYWRSRLKALAWSAAWSTQFEIGPVSQASIGNVGLHGKQTYVDIVMTPTAGLGLLILEDYLDQKIIRVIERKSKSYYVKITTRTFLNPTRSVANLLQFKTPWYRADGLR